jgi:flagellar assembly protein FliH
MRLTSFEAPSKEKRETSSQPFQYATVFDANGDGVSSWSAPSGLSLAEVEQRERERYESGVRDGEGKASVAHEAEVAAIRSLVAKGIEEFAREREGYFRRIEPEVVQLALAIARKILHREAQMDPLLLTGMVHVALEKLDSGTSVRMRVNPGDVQSWSEYFGQNSTLQPAPELIGDAALQHGECGIDTEVGSTTISLDMQLKEIEQGFFDLLEQRPRVRQ